MTPVLRARIESASQAIGSTEHLTRIRTDKGPRGQRLQQHVQRWSLRVLILGALCGLAFCWLGSASAVASILPASIVLFMLGFVCAFSFHLIRGIVLTEAAEQATPLSLEQLRKAVALTQESEAARWVWFCAQQQGRELHGADWRLMNESLRTERKEQAAARRLHATQRSQPENESASVSVRNGSALASNGDAVLFDDRAWEANQKTMIYEAFRRGSSF